MDPRSPENCHAVIPPEDALQNFPLTALGKQKGHTFYGI